MVYPLILSFLLMILLFFPLFMTQKLPIMILLRLNSDLARIKQWGFQWKMNFNPDPNKQAQEVIFSRKLKKVCVSTIIMYLRHHRKSI